MNTMTTIIGVIAVLFGIVTTVMRFMRRPGEFARLGPMQERFGARAGYAVHLIFYSILPIIFGAIMIYLGLTGIAFF